jgi:hypothetical protein
MGVLLIRAEPLYPPLAVGVVAAARAEQDATQHRPLALVALEVFARTDVTNKEGTDEAEEELPEQHAAASSVYLSFLFFARRTRPSVERLRRVRVVHQHGPVPK